jgi:hypothetical protein
LIAEHVERDPTLVDKALLTLDHWLAEGVAPAFRLNAWRQILLDAKSSAEGFAALLRLLRDDSEESRRMKDFGPFAGFLSREERRKVFLKCAYDH